MEDYVMRMKKECRELEKLTATLNAFIHGDSVFKGLDHLEQARMIKQAGFMEAYMEVLKLRIWCAKDS